MKYWSIFIEYVYKTVIAIAAFFFSVDSIDWVSDSGDIKDWQHVTQAPSCGFTRYVEGKMTFFITSMNEVPEEQKVEQLITK